MKRIVKNIPLMDLMSYLIESVDAPTHVGILQIFEPVNGSCSDIIQRVLKAYRESEVGPPFNYYPVFPRFGMPKWAEAEYFDSSYHIRHAAVPQPGTQQQLIDMVMDLHAGIMDRSRPGWIAYVIEGLEDNCFAVYWKVHHAYIDGASAILRFEASMAKTPEDLEVRPLWGPLFAPFQDDRDPSLSKRLSETGKGLGTQAKAMMDIAQAISRSVKQARGHLEREAPLPFSAPNSLFNKPVFATRHLGLGATGLDRFKTIAKQEKVSINEVALTLVGAALDRYSQLHGETPDGQLVAACPMAVRKEGDTDASTQIAAISIKLGDSALKIGERLRQVHISSRDAKDEAKHMSREALMNYLVLIGGAATLLSKSPLSRYIPPLTSVNVSNVAGPDYRCYLSGAEMIRSYPVSTLAGGTAINITFSSFSGRMDYAVITDALAVPGAQEIADFMADAMDELETAIIAPEKPKLRKKSPRGKTTRRKKPARSRKH
ncbi:MAG: wax ester/triacylglycerol synthase family O-acyltransferase [Gammaproteobacteria bacterium]|nr:wax ester/triacylglycerol synthase family O-acyltransferase [Gammaproteobacteria bacterium]